MATVVLRGSALMTGHGLEKEWGLKMENGRISQIGPNKELIVQDQDQVMELKGQIILPGFVNGHNHMYGFLSHGITADAMVTEFESFLDDFWWPYVEDRINHKLVEATTTWACVEMIDSGVTSFVDILEGPNSIPEVLEVERKVVEKSGFADVFLLKHVSV